MGWVNYVVVPSHKLALEINRHSGELEEHEKNTLDSIIGIEEFDEPGIDINSRRLKREKDGRLNLSLNLGQLRKLIKSYEQAETIKAMGLDKLLMYWLKKKNIEYEIISEHVLADKGYANQGWIIINPVYKEEE
jgi:hypothetical protein